MYNPNIKTPALEMDRGYNTLTDKIGTDSDDTTDDGETESGDDQNVSTDEETFNNLDSTLKDGIEAILLEEVPGIIGVENI